MEALRCQMRVPGCSLVDTAVTKQKCKDLSVACKAAIMPEWKLEFRCGVGRNAVKADLTFRRGLFQGDSLSHLLFCCPVVERAEGHAFRICILVE